MPNLLSILHSKAVHPISEAFAIPGGFFDLPCKFRKCLFFSNSDVNTFDCVFFASVLFNSITSGKICVYKQHSWST